MVFCQQSVSTSLSPSDDNMPINLWRDDFIYIALRWQPAVYNKKQEIVSGCSIVEIKHL